MLNPKPDPQNILSFSKVSLWSTISLQLIHMKSSRQDTDPPEQSSSGLLYSQHMQHSVFLPPPWKTFFILVVQAHTGTHPGQTQPSALQRQLHPQFDSGKLPVSDGHRKSEFPPWVCLQRGQWGRATASKKERHRLQSCLNYVPASTIESSSENPEVIPSPSSNMGSI